MTANGSKSYLCYLKKLVEQDNSSYHRSVGSKPIDANFPNLTKEIESSYKTPKFRVGDRVKIIKYRNIFSKGYTRNWATYWKLFNGLIKLKM